MLTTNTPSTIDPNFKFYIFGWADRTLIETATPGGDKLKPRGGNSRDFRTGTEGESQFYPETLRMSHHLSSNSGEPAKDRISLLTLCATLNDSATAEVSSSPSPQVAVIIARWANF
jgi:hypothetical protein